MWKYCWRFYFKKGHMTGFNSQTQTLQKMDVTIIIIIIISFGEWKD